LTNLTSQIKAEERNVERLRSELKVLADKKVVLKKKAGDGMEFVRGVEGTLERTLARLKMALAKIDGGNEGGQSEVLEGVTSNSLTEGESLVDALHHDQVLQINSDEVPQDLVLLASEEAANEVDDRQHGTMSDNCELKPTFIEIPLHHNKTNTIQWPQNTTNVIQSKSTIPSWRTNLPRASLWNNIHSPDLITKLMNIASLESLMERQHLVEAKLLPADAGWVKESRLIGTSLDIFRHVDFKHLNVSRQSSESKSNPSNEASLDPNAILCPYELGGTCADDRCPYQHLGRRPEPSVITLENGERFLRYYSLPELRLPVLSRDDFIDESPTEKEVGVKDEGAPAVDTESRVRDNIQAEHMPADRAFPCPTCATAVLNADDLRTHLKHCNPSSFVLHGTTHTVQNVLIDKTSANIENKDKQVPDGPVDASDITNNLDFVDLPTVDDRSDDDSSTESVAEEHNAQRRGLIFDGSFWWQSIMSQPKSESYSSCNEVIDMILVQFGFKPIRENSQGRESQIRMLRCEQILLAARTVDFCRVCVHMGQKSLGLSLLQGVIQFNQNEATLLQHAVKLISARACCGSACDLFDCQVRLLLISEYYRLEYAWLCGNESSRKEPSIDELVIFLNNEASTNSGFDAMNRHLSSRIPSSPLTDTSQSSWDHFVSVLQRRLDKHITVPFSYKMTKKQQFSLLLECIGIGQSFQDLLNSIQDSAFSPLVHVLDPVWSVMQPLVQKSTAQHLDDSNLLVPQILVLLVMGPIVYSSVAHTMQTSGLSSSDSRKRLDMLALDKFIVEMIKDLRRSGWNNVACNNAGPLLSPLSSLSVAVSVSLGAFDKVQQRLENALNTNNKFAHRELPSMNILSEMLWSQLVHLRMNCPYNSSEFANTENSCSPTELLRPSITNVQFHVVSNMLKNGIALCGIDLCGDQQMLSASCTRTDDRSQWCDLISLAESKYDGKELNEEPSENCKSYQFHVTTEAVKPDRFHHAVFPLSVLVSGQALTHLSLVGCMLDELPYSIGVHLTGLLVSDIFFIIISTA
jgi:hypothetical protein